MSLPIILGLNTLFLTSFIMRQKTEKADFASAKETCFSNCRA